MSDAATETRRWPGETLRASGISRSFEGLQALSGVTLELHRHEVVGLIGPNGAGKTTLVNVMTGFDFPTEGAVELAGEDITSWQPHKRARAGLARTYQHSRLFKGLSARENVEVAALGVGAGPKEARQRADELLELLGIGHRANTPAAVLPHGEEHKLGVARALATRPRFVLMDEPAAGLSEAEVPDFAEVVTTVRNEREAGVLLIDHNVGLILDVCDRIQVLDQGRTLAEGTPEEIRRNIDVTAAYLGDVRG
ncbi:MAG TPA: ABC transporter ATP-binding protein [Gaiellaceae bacterium]|nr:ABC transporter ATP-binding protein [Gaiellaceae bacterium]